MEAKLDPASDPIPEPSRRGKGSRPRQPPFDLRGHLYRSHLLIYGTDSEKPNGLRQRILPEGGDPDYTRAVSMEAIYGLIFFSLMVVPYRLIANPTQSLPDLVFGRTLLPALTFVCGMAFFIVIKFPRSMNDPIWIQTRGLVGGILTAFCLCGGMFM